MTHQLLGLFVFLYFQPVCTLLIVPPDSQNTEWRYGYKPEPSCNNLFPDETSLTEGYFCIDNYVRGANDQCIYVFDCPEFKIESTTRPSCPIGESYRTGLYPEPSCNDLYPEAKGIKEGCYCDDHAVRNPQGKCVSVYECLQFISTTTTTSATPVCPAGEYYTACLYPEPSCDNLYPENVDIKEGCFCQDNYIRNSEGKCIEIGQCDLFAKPQPNEATNVIIYGCFKCVPGTSFNVDCNVCTCGPDGKSTICTTKDCGSRDYDLRSGPPRCPAGEIFRKGQELTCDESIRDFFTIKRGCLCAPGLVRNSAGKCVSMNDCNATPTTGLTCVPGTRVHKICEICICQPDGKTLECLPTPCAPPRDIEK